MTPLWTKVTNSDAIRAYVHELRGIAVILPKSNRSTKPALDDHFYVERHRIENLLGRLK